MLSAARMEVVAHFFQGREFVVEFSTPGWKISAVPSGPILPELLSPPARTHSGQPESSAAKLLLLTYQEGRP